jgi:multiple antibiotic resistance protein
MEFNTLSLFSITVVLFIIMDPVGNIPSYLTLVKDLSPERRRYVLIREMLIALAFMLVFNFIGEYIFSILELSDTAVKLSSGLILFLTAIKILFPAANSFRMNLPKGEPFIIPLAVPLIAGPSLLATIMLYAKMETSILMMMEAIVIAWVLALLVLLAGPRLNRYLGNNGLKAFERLMAMVLVMLAIQRFMEGIQTFVDLKSWAA